MGTPMVGSLLNSENIVPRRGLWKIWVAIAVIGLAAGGLTYKFYNYRAEGSVKEFLAEVSSGQIDAAFAKWDLEGSSYTRKDFESDWGKDGYWTKDAAAMKVMDSNRRGGAVVVFVAIDKFKVPEALLVNNQTLKLSYAPNNKYKAER